MIFKVKNEEAPELISNMLAYGQDVGILVLGASFQDINKVRVFTVEKLGSRFYKQADLLDEFFVHAKRDGAEYCSGGAKFKILRNPLPRELSCKDYHAVVFLMDNLEDYKIESAIKKFKGVVC